VDGMCIMEAGVDTQKYLGAVPERVGVERRQ